jgi:hypothetical protein
MVVLSDVRDELLKQTADATPGRRGSLPGGDTISSVSRIGAGAEKHFTLYCLGFSATLGSFATQAGARGCLANLARQRDGVQMMASGC